MGAAQEPAREGKRLLIISNTPLSRTENNGKTVLSYIDACGKAQVRQLYFHAERPTVAGYRYFQIADMDVLRGRLRPSRRGRAVEAQSEGERQAAFSFRRHMGRGEALLWAREALWFRGWKSKQLLQWLDDFQPTAVFFVAGDALFAYAICRFIAHRYRARLTVYMTDDYLLPGRRDRLLLRLRKAQIRRNLQQCLAMAAQFYTVSEPMRQAYRQALGRDSLVAFNMTEDLRDTAQAKTGDGITLVYAGSFYYGRAALLGEIGQALQRYNEETAGPRALLHLYNNYALDEEMRQAVCVEGGSAFGGALDRERLRACLNAADILVFVESFAPEQAEKTRYSLSTKVPEYLSLGKPILAVGPPEVASMAFLQGAALCVHAPEKLEAALRGLLLDPSARARYGALARQRFEALPEKRKLQEEFLARVMGE